MNTKSDENVVLEKVIGHTLAGFLMMFGEPVKKEDVIGFSGECVTAAVTFKNSASGLISITVPYESCAIFAANAMGRDVDNDITDISGFDAVKEFINVAAGHYVTEIYGRDRNIELSPPKIAKHENTEWKNAVNEAQLLFLVDEIPLAVKVLKGQ